MKNILIIGGCGYIGSELHNFLLPSYNIDTVDLEWYGNYVNADNMAKDMSTLTSADLEKYQAIILLAAHSSVKMCENNMVSTMKNNVLNFVKLLDLVRDEQLLIYASSSSVYGDTKKRKVTEEYTTFEPNNFYDLSKHEIDSYAMLSGKKVFGLRFGTVNGGSPNFRSDVMINAMTYNAKKNGKVFCFNPEIHRPILGIMDLCAAVKTLLEKGNHENRGIYNLSSFNTTALEISNKVAKTLGVPLEVVDKLPDVVTNVKLQTKAYNFMIDSSKFSKVFEYDFQDTVETIVDSITQNFEQMNKDNRSNAKLY